MLNVIVIKEYKTYYPDPIAVKKHDEVLFNREEDPEYPNWFFCKSLITNKEGWVPKQILSAPDDSSIAKVIEDYSAHELTVQKDEKLTALRQLNEWSFCKTQTGELGWIPTENLMPL